MSNGGGAGGLGAARPPPRIDGMVSLKASTNEKLGKTLTKWRPAGNVARLDNLFAASKSTRVY